jgi:hypothetical protein
MTLLSNNSAGRKSLLLYKCYFPIGVCGYVNPHGLNRLDRDEINYLCYGPAADRKISCTTVRAMNAAGR